MAASDFWLTWTKSGQKKKNNTVSQGGEKIHLYIIAGTIRMLGAKNTWWFSHAQDAFLWQL